LPGKAIEKVKLFDISFQDLIVHFLMYFVFSVLLIKELSAKENNRFSKMSGWIIPLLATAVLGVVTEIIQHLWISGRYGSMSDFILDIAGSASAILFCRISWFRNMFKL
jgi:VanZ family protein